MPVSLGFVRTLNGSQVVPASPVIQTSPFASVMDPAFPSENETARKSARVKALTRVQVSPASSLRATHPLWPETTIWVLETNATPVICSSLHGDAVDHFFPPSRVTKTVPSTPTAAAFSGSNAATLLRCSLVPEL